MSYIQRSAERKFLKMSGFFKVILVTGARQVGKTTMLKRLAERQSRTYVSLDNLLARDLARKDPVMFFQTYKPPIIIDEVQYAPELFSQIKIICDNRDETGLFWLTGSQRFEMMKNVQESLAGRIGILEMYSLSKREQDSLFTDEPLAFSLDNLLERQKHSAKTDIVSVFDYIYNGGMPQVFTADDELRREYFDSYVSTYLMRDATEFGGVTDTLRFGKFITACAALTGQILNIKTLADVAEISQPAAHNWLRLLEGMGIIYLLRPFSNNALKRLVKAPKLYFLDTGLAAHLSMWPTVDTLLNGAASGAFFENFVVTELLKNLGAYAKANLSYYRDQNTKEIDLLVEIAGLIHPLEIKKSANPDRRDVEKFGILSKIALQRGNGGIVCMCEDVIPIDSENCFIPCGLL
ncbi:MAG: ATP-binding protein [Clostridiales bacterium]|jgi:predicted AAA+ superfamily ATPase|nr:ATP-binding protein [Clostridiales bacterium]